MISTLSHSFVFFYKGLEGTKYVLRTTLHSEESLMLEGFTVEGNMHINQLFQRSMLPAFKRGLERLFRES